METKISGSIESNQLVQNEKNDINKDYLINELIKDFDVKSKDNRVEIYFLPLNMDEYKDEILFCKSGNLELDKYDYQHKYFGSSTRLGEEFEIFNPENGYKYLKFKIKINGNIVFEENINFKVLNQEYLKIKSENYCENSIDEIRDSIKSDRACIFNNYTNILIKHKYIDIKFSFRDLHRFNYSVEVCGIHVVLTKI